MSNGIYPEDWDVHAAQTLRRKRDHYWLMLGKARTDYYQNLLDNSIEYARYENAFYDHMLSVHGLRVMFEGISISADYEVVDEKKYTLFLMKYGS